jgi:hypothetical protein
MDRSPSDPPLPAGVAHILKQLTAFANPQAESAAYNPDRNALAPETLVGPFSTVASEHPWQSHSNLVPDQRVPGNTSMSTVVSNRETLPTLMDSQPAETIDYLAELRKITANAQSQPKRESLSDSGSRPTRSIAAPPSSAAKPAILEWAPALRHVNRLGLTNPDFQTVIQKVTPTATRLIQCCEAPA